MLDGVLNTASLADARDLARVCRVGAHSHIKGLSTGMVGQEKARRAARIVGRMVQENKLAGRSILLSGRPGTGKTAVALGLARDLGEQTPFVHMTASEVFSLELSKTEVLTQGLRKAIGVRVKESTEVLEGEVVELSIENTYMNKKRGTITLRTSDMESLYNIGPKMIATLEQQNVTAGDVISINKTSGHITKIGRSFARSHEYEVVSQNVSYVQRPEGEIQHTREVVHSVTLHDIDVINSRTQGFLALFAGDTGEIKQEIRKQVDDKVCEWKDEAKAEVCCGVLFIDECHLLDSECFSFLNRALECETAPLVVLATNRGITRIRGSSLGELAPHGIPLDFLDRTLIIPTQPYSKEEVEEIIRKRLDEEDLSMDPDSIALLTTIATDTSLRYALHLVSVAAVSALKRKCKSDRARAHTHVSALSVAAVIGLEDVQRVFKLFLDLKRSTQYLELYKNQFID